MTGAGEPGTRAPAPDVSVIIPCLNEEATVGVCVRKARSAIERMGVEGEVIVAGMNLMGYDAMALGLFELCWGWIFCASGWRRPNSRSCRPT